MKKLIAVLLTLALLVGVSMLPASAAVAPQVYVDAPAQAQPGEIIAVSLYVNNGNEVVGGVEGTVTYDSSMLTYVGVTLREDVVLIGNVEDVTVRQTEDGVRFVTVSNVTGGNPAADAWLTLNFRVEAATGSAAAVAVEEMKVSDWMGEGCLELGAGYSQPEDAGIVRIITVGTDDPIDVLGATIRTDGAGIRYQAGIDSAFKNTLTLKEAGIVMLPTVLLYEDQDLTKETVGRRGAKPAIAYTTDASKLARIAAGESLFGTLTNGVSGNRANVQISARSYLTFSDGTTVYYSHNEGSNIVAGEAVRSVVKVAQTIANNEIAAANGALNNHGLGTILTAETLTESEVQTLIDFCCDNIAYLQQ